MGMLNAMARQQPGFQSTGPAYPHYTQRMAETGQLSLGASAQPQQPGLQGMGAPNGMQQAGASPFVSPAQQALMGAGMGRGNALNAAAQQQMHADRFAGALTAQLIQQLYPQKRPSHHLGGGR